MAKANVAEDTEAEVEEDMKQEEEEEDMEQEAEQEEEDHLLPGGIPTPREDSNRKLPRQTSQ